MKPLSPSTRSVYPLATVVHYDPRIRSKGGLPSDKLDADCMPEQVAKNLRSFARSYAGQVAVG